MGNKTKKVIIKIAIIFKIRSVKVSPGCKNHILNSPPDKNYITLGYIISNNYKLFSLNIEVLG